jgi:phosphatidylethanolamine-binding protein (PEBP) family uncharacterized protein
MLALALTGCGSSNSVGTAASKVATPKPPKSTTVSLSSPAIHGSTLPSLYTCDGKNISPPLSWGKVPSTVSELVVLALDVTPGQTKKAPAVEWAVGGLKASLTELAAGKLPAGAFTEPDTNGKKGYSICPARGHARTYKFALYALPGRARTGEAFPGPQLLFNLTESAPELRASVTGEFTVTYKRK